MSDNDTTIQKFHKKLLAGLIITELSKKYPDIFFDTNFTDSEKELFELALIVAELEKKSNVDKSI